MLVDDDPELAQLLAAQLVRAGFEAQTADCVQSALRLASEQPRFDVLITDLHLPDGDGAGVAKALGLGLNLALTGSSSTADSARLLAAGFSAVLVKPINGKQLVEAVRRSLGGAS
jgi:DNA-binding response OmpR family regulator